MILSLVYARQILNGLFQIGIMSVYMILDYLAYKARWLVETASCGYRKPLSTMEFHYCHFNVACMAKMVWVLGISTPMAHTRAMPLHSHIMLLHRRAMPLH